MTEKTDAQKARDLILNAPIDPEYQPIDNLPIPLSTSVLVKKLGTYEEKRGTIIIPGRVAENSRPPHIGIIYGVGPQCSEYMLVGRRIYYNFYVDSAFFIDGIEYAKLSESDVFYYVNPKVSVEDGVKPDKEVMRTEKMAEQVSREERLDRRDDNEKDERLDKTKGKNRLLPGNLKN